MKIVIVGAGKSGIAAAELLLSAKAVPVLFDSNEKTDPEEVRKKLPEGAQVKILVGALPAQELDEISLAVFSPGVAVDTPFADRIRERAIPIWGEVELGYAFLKGRLIAITGTNGKTTTTALTGQIMRDYYPSVFVVGNIGDPITAEVSATREDSVTVAEISSFQLETADAFHPQVSAILNITPDHLERHHTMEAYAAAKGRIFENMGSEDSLLLNADDAYTPQFAEKASAHVYLLSTSAKVEEGAYLSAEGMLRLRIDGRDIDLVPEKELQIRGHHNVEDALAAAFLAYQGGVPLSAIRDALRSYHALEHRVEYVRTFRGVAYYNDSKATNTDAAEKALGAFHEPVLLIAGGHDKGTPLTSFMQCVRGHVRQLILLGQAAERFRQAAAEAGIDRIVMAKSMEDAVQQAAAMAEPGDVVLLSPACSSFDMYHSYGERGRDFKRIVQALS